MTSAGQTSPNGATTATETTDPLRIWLCSHPRTASNVLAKQLRDHPQLAFKQDSMMDACFFGPEKLFVGYFPMLKPEAKDTTFQDGFNDLEQFLVRAESEGKTLFMKEHILFLLDPEVAASRFPPADGQPKPCPKVTYKAGKAMTEELSPPETVKTNPTVLPDGFIRTLSPIIQIRHPAISIPSYYRAILHVTGDDDLFTDDFLYNRTYVFSRMIFDWYCDNVFPERKKTQRGHDSYPLVVDGIDLVDDNERVISAICELTGLDKQGVSTGWDPVSDEARKKQLPHQERFLSTLQSSSGVMKSGFKNGEISIETEAEKWVEEFGSKAANRLKEVAEATMDDYMYLRQYRV